MGIHFHCQACDNSISVRDAAAGQSIYCPDCGQKLVIPRPLNSTGNKSSIGSSKLNSNDKSCAACGETAAQLAEYCRYCGQDFTPTRTPKPTKRPAPLRPSTPSGVGDPELFPVADLGKRLGAAVVDSMALFVFVVPGIVLTFGTVNKPDAPSPIVGLLLAAFGSVALVALHGWLMLKRSQSIGKYFMSIQIFDPRPCGLRPLLPAAVGCQFGDRLTSVHRSVLSPPRYCFHLR